MLFEITKTSLWGEDKPIDNCFPIKLTRVDTRHFSSFEEYDKNNKTKWTDEGTNHRVLPNGYIARDMGEKDAWGININSMNDLVMLMKEVKEELVLGTSWIDNTTPRIEIYDTWRE